MYNYCSIYIYIYMYNYCSIYIYIYTNTRTHAINFSLSRPQTGLRPVQGQLITAPEPCAGVRCLRRGCALGGGVDMGSLIVDNIT